MYFLNHVVVSFVHKHHFSKTPLPSSRNLGLGCLIHDVLSISRSFDSLLVELDVHLVSEGEGKKVILERQTEGWGTTSNQR